MKKYLLLSMISIGLVAQSCNTMKKSRVDDDFYDFKTESSQEKIKNTAKKAKSGESTYNNTKAEVENINQLPKPVKVTSRTEKAKVILGAANKDAKFFIIMGSFSVEDNAHKLVEKLRSQGFYPSVLLSPTGLYRVSGYHFNEESAARVEIGQIRQNHQEYTDAWLLIKE